MSEENNDSDANSPLTGIKKAESLAKIFNLVALPVALGVAGWWVQSSINQSTKETEFIKIAVGVLSQASPDKDNNKALRVWAVKTLATHSEIRFSEGEILGLEKGYIKLPEINRDSEGRITSMDYSWSGDLPLDIQKEFLELGELDMDEEERAARLLGLWRKAYKTPE